MLDEKSAYRLLQASATDQLHRKLDAMQPGETPEDRFQIAHWRAAAFARERRFPEALDLLRRTRSDFPCRTVAHDEAARILEHLGRRGEAIEELRAAPFDEEAECFPELVKDAKFVLLYLLCRAGIKSVSPSLDEFDDEYRSVLPTERHCYAEHLSTSDLRAILGGS